jgi:hypothetical protein
VAAPGKVKILLDWTPFDLRERYCVILKRYRKKRIGYGGTKDSVKKESSIEYLIILVIFIILIIPIVVIT